jgi:hypothetical protein
MTGTMLPLVSAKPRFGLDFGWVPRAGIGLSGSEESGYARRLHERCHFLAYQRIIETSIK